MKNRLKTIKEALDPETVSKQGFNMKEVKELAAETGIKGVWNDGDTKIYPVYVLYSGPKEDDWFKPIPRATTIGKFINFINGSDVKYVKSEVIGIFSTQEDANTVYQAIPVREEK